MLFFKKFIYLNHLVHIYILIISHISLAQHPCFSQFHGHIFVYSPRILYYYLYIHRCSLFFIFLYRNFLSGFTLSHWKLSLFSISFKNPVALEFWLENGDTCIRIHYPYIYLSMNSF